MRRIRRRLELALGLGLDAMQRHELSDPLLTYPNAVCQQPLPHPRPTILTFDLGADRPDVGQQGIVTDPATQLAPMERTSLAMLVVPVGADLQLFAQEPYRPDALVSIDESVLHVEYFATYAAAF